MAKSKQGHNKGHDNIKGTSFRERPHNINKKGRPPKLLHQVNEDLKGKGYQAVTEGQIIEAYEMLLQLPKAEVQKLTNDKEKPYFLTLVARWMDSARGMEMLDRIMDRAFGRVRIRQEMEVKLPEKQVIRIGGQDVEF